MNLQLMLSKLQHVCNHLSYAGSLLLFDIRLDQVHIEEMENCKTVLSQQREIMKKIFTHRLHSDHWAAGSSQEAACSKYLLYSKEFDFADERSTSNNQPLSETESKSSPRRNKKLLLNEASAAASENSSHRLIEPVSIRKIPPIRKDLRPDPEAHQRNAKLDFSNPPQEEGLDGSKSSPTEHQRDDSPLSLPRRKKLLHIDTSSANPPMRRSTANRMLGLQKEKIAQPIISPLSAGASNGAKKDLEAMSLQLFAMKRFERAKSDEDIKDSPRGSPFGQRKNQLIPPAGCTPMRQANGFSVQSLFKDDYPASQLGTRSSKPKSKLSPKPETTSLQTFRKKLHRAVALVMRPAAATHFLAGQPQKTPRGGHIDQHCII